MKKDTRPATKADIAEIKLLLEQMATKSDIFDIQHHLIELDIHALQNQRTLYKEIDRMAYDVTDIKSSLSANSLKSQSRVA